MRLQDDATGREGVIDEAAQAQSREPPVTSMFWPLIHRASVAATKATTSAMSTLQGMSQQARDGATRAQLEAIARLAMRAWP